MLEEGRDLYRIEVDGLGVYAAVERDCPRADERRLGKPDGAWLPRVGTHHPGAISLFTETGLAKYWGSGLMRWHASVVRAPLAVRRASHSGAPRHRDRFQVITDPTNVAFVETLAFPHDNAGQDGRRRGVIFWDFDGTLAFSTPMWGRAARAALSELAPGHAFDLPRLKALFNEVFPWHRPEQEHATRICSTTWWAWMEAEFSECFVAIGASADVAAAVAQRIKPVILDPNSYRVIDGVVPTLVALRAAGWRHVILSNHVPELGAIVESLGLHGLFDHVVTSGTVGREKPHRGIFDHAVALAGSRGEPMWMVGDNPQADMAGAKQVGIPGILVGHQLGAADHRAAHLSEIPSIVHREEGFP